MYNKAEFHINNKAVPVWENDPDGQPLDLKYQPQDTQDYFKQELRKVTSGLTISGVEIHPWTYFHLNFWKLFSDVKDPKTGYTRTDVVTPYLRDNEWLWNESLKRAEAQKKGIVAFGTRRFSKSAFIGSFIGWNALTKYGGEQRVNSVVGGSEPDLDNVKAYIDFGLHNMAPLLKYPRSGTNWDEGITLGKVYSNNEKEIFSKITVTNLDSGKTKATQKTAGATPISWVCDEIGKFPFKKAFNTAKASFEALDGSGWRCTPILIGTSGEVEQAKDAFSVVHNPAAYNLLEMDWNLLERYCENPTWKKKTFGIFVPAQMAMKTGVVKDKTNLADFLKVDSKDLKKIPIQVTNWERSTKAIKKGRELLKKSQDKTDYNDDVMFYPFDTDDCFLRSGDNPFPSQRAQLHLREILQNGDTGKHVDVYAVGSSKQLGYQLSEKLPPKYPFGGGIAEAPFIMFEEPPEDNTIDGTYVAGLDHYKHTKSGTSSLGCLTIYKRKVNINDEFEDSLVGIYTARPKSMYEFNKTCEILLEGYGAVCLQENADISFQEFLERKNKEHILLANGLEMIKASYNPKAKQNNVYGLPPTPKNKEYLLKLVIDYCWEEIIIGYDEDNEPITDIGVTRIKDIGLLEEIIDFMNGDNFDRITSFAHALAWARYLDFLNVLPNPKQKKTSKKNKRMNRESSGMYGSMRRRGGGFY